MTNDEGMTKSKGQSPQEDYDPFGGDGNTAVVREEADEENDEARMTKDERMTKHDARNAPECDEAFWTDAKVSIVREEPDAKRVFDLEERTARFGEAVIDFAKTIPQDAVTNRIISQLVGAATSVGANYVEADDAVSKKEFLKNVPERSSRNETLSSHGSRRARAKTKARMIWLEAKELHLIFSRIWRSGKNE